MEVGEPNQLRVVDEQPEQPTPVRQLADLRRDVGVDAGIDELRQLRSVAKHTEGNVAGVEQIGGRLNDALQRRPQLQAGRHGQEGLEQTGELVAVRREPIQVVGLVRR